MFKNSKILVTGGAGLIGTNLISRLILESPHHIRATVLNRRPQIHHPDVEYICSDLTKKDDCNYVTRGMDYVFMCAATNTNAARMNEQPLLQVTPNVIMNTLLLDAAYKQQAKKVLFVSSTTVYPSMDRPVKEDDVLKGDLFDKYFFVGWVKMFTEVLSDMYSHKIRKSMPVVAVRAGNTYGEYDNFDWNYSHVIPALIRRVVEKHDPIQVWGDGKDRKDVTYVGDLVKGILLAMQNLDSYDPVNLASGQSYTIREILDEIMDLEGCSGTRVEFDLSKPTMIPSRLVNIDKARRLLGYRPNTTLREGLAKTIAWYKESVR